MILFIIGIIAFVGSIFAFILFQGLWTFEDAKVKAPDHPPLLWVLVVTLFSSPLGLLIYLLVGRSNKQANAPGKYKTAFIVSAIAFVVSIILFVVGTVTFVLNADTNTNTFIMFNSRTRNQEWVMTGRSANGSRSHSPTLSATQLGNLAVSSTNSEGAIMLVLTQGSIREVVDITGDFFGTINTSSFQPGRINMRVQFYQARDINITINWGA